jgi:biopolymer transport protein TolR
MKKDRKPRKGLVAEINVVPYIDVMLVLLVIFMITAPLLSEGVKVNLPKASAEALDSKEKEPLIITVDHEGKYFLNVNKDPKQVIQPNELTLILKNELTTSIASNSNRPVLIKGDKDVNYGKVVQAMVLLQQAGIQNVGLMTEMPEPTNA